MRVPPILASLFRHWLTVALMVLATAFTCAIVCNVAAMVAHRVALLHAPSGINDESSVIVIDSSRVDAARLGSTNGGGARLAGYQADVAALREITGVRSAAAVFGLPFHGGMSVTITRKADDQSGLDNVTGFFGGPGELATLGLRLIHGRDFLSSEYIPAGGFKGLDKVSSVIVSRALAQRLFPGINAVGHTVYQAGHPMVIVGVVDHLMVMNPTLGAEDNEYAMLFPLRPDSDYVMYVVRTALGEQARVLRQAVKVLDKRDSARVLSNVQTFAELRASYFRSDSALIALLLVAGLGLLVVTAAGIAGLSGFWVQQRIRTIGIRRAVGATRMDIIRYFHVENFLITTSGISFGWILAYAFNFLLMKHYALQSLSPSYLLLGALALWLMGQLAVLGPALRGAAVAPMVATRSV